MQVQLRSGENVVVPLKTVGGIDGVFGVWRNGRIVHFAAGDDGHWWEIGAYDIYWLPGDNPGAD
jgi:hypothetical protein